MSESKVSGPSSRRVIEEALKYARELRETPHRNVRGEIRVGEISPPSPGFKAAVRLDLP